MSTAVDMFLRSKKASNCRETYLVSLRQYLTLFARERKCADADVSSITSEQIEEWFLSRNEAPSSRAANLGRLSSFFAWCKRRKYIAENPCDYIEKIRIDREAPQILTVDQIQQCLNFCRDYRPRLLLWFVLAGLVGIRRDELLKLSKADVQNRLADRLIIIDAAASKVRRRRIVELTDWQHSWVEYAVECERSELPLPDTFVVKSLRRLRVVLGLDAWPQDVLRHTALSHTLAEVRDAAKVALWSGNSARILLVHYNGIVLPRENARLRSVTPDPHSAVAKPATTISHNDLQPA